MPPLAYHGPPSVPFLTRSLFAVLVPGALLVPLAACFPGGGNVASHLASPPSFDPPDQAKCSVRKSADHPLIVEWPSADRATLEAKAQSGLVAVRYVGCEMEVLHRCKLPGKYAYTAITPKHDAVTIKDADDLYANMPVGAAKLEGKLEKSGQLQVSMTIVGRFEADQTSFTPDQLDGEDCDRATHVVSGMTTGAFELSAGASANVGGSATAFGAGAGGKSTSSHETLERDGHEEKCEGGSGRPGEPPDGCGAVLRLDLVPLPGARSANTRRRRRPRSRWTRTGSHRGSTPRETCAWRRYCAEHGTVMTPELGLRLLVDGKTDPEKPLKSNLMTVMATQTVNNHPVPVMVNNVTDVGFVLPPGPASPEHPGARLRAHRDGREALGHARDGRDGGHGGLRIEPQGPDRRTRRLRVDPRGLLGAAARTRSSTSTTSRASRGALRPPAARSASRTSTATSRSAWSTPSAQGRSLGCR